MRYKSADLDIKYLLLYIKGGAAFAAPPILAKRAHVSDVTTAVAAATEGARASIVGVAVWIPDYAIHLSLKLQLADPLVLCSDSLLILLLLELGKLRVNIGVDRAGLLVHLGCQVGSRQPVVAAALSKLCLDAVAGLQNGGVGAC